MSLTLVVDRAEDPTDFRVFIHPKKMEEMRISDRSFVRITSQTEPPDWILARVSPQTPVGRFCHIQMSRGLRLNLKVFLGQVVDVSACANEVYAERVEVSLVTDTTVGINGGFSDLFTESSFNYRNLAVRPGFVIPIYAVNRVVEFVVRSCHPENGFCLESSDALVVVKPMERQSSNMYKYGSICYDDISGIPTQIQSLRFLIEMTLVRPTVRDAFGVPFPRGIVITAPIGCGKTLIGEAIKNETPAVFKRFTMYNIFPRTSEQAAVRMRDIANEILSRKEPAILFIDDIDEILQPRRVKPNVIDRRIEFALIAIVDKLLAESDIMVVATTKNSDSLPTALCQVNRLGYHIEIPSPNLQNRVEILKTMTRSMVISSETIRKYAKDADSGAALRVLIDKAIMKQLAMKVGRSETTKALPVGDIRSMELDKDDIIWQSRQRNTGNA